jgi:hypothetical protein
MSASPVPHGRAALRARLQAGDTESKLFDLYVNRAEAGDLRTCLAISRLLEDAYGRVGRARERDALAEPRRVMIIGCETLDPETGRMLGSETQAKTQ